MEIGGDCKESKFVDARIEQLQKRQNELEKIHRKNATRGPSTSRLATKS